MRRAGILCHLTSLPNGRLGRDTNHFLHRLNEIGATIWQMLPINPPDEHGSPYAGLSSFAIWAVYRDQDTRRSAPMDLEEREEGISHWVYDWALFAALKEEQEGRPWLDWPKPLREREESALEEARARLASKIGSLVHDQVMLTIHWQDFQMDAEGYGVELLGDLPFFLAHDSADVWANQHLFKLEESGAPAVVAGVPPDYFSEEGQRWGTVHYNWDAHRADGFAWWKSRMTRMFDLFDIVRIDHFRAIDSAWAIPAHHPTAEHGEWVQGPGDEFLEAILEVSPKGGLVAEDLGIIPDSVVEMRKRHRLPGMAVLQFANDDSGNPHNPENHTENQVVYTGTHDNDTTVGWGKKPVKEMMTAVLSSPAELAILPLQDVMGLGSEARMNTPGTLEGNWQWRFEWEELKMQDLNWLGQQIHMSHRAPSRR